MLPTIVILWLLTLVGVQAYPCSTCLSRANDNPSLTQVKEHVQALSQQILDFMRTIEEYEQAQREYDQSWANQITLGHSQFFFYSVLVLLALCVILIARKIRWRRD